MAAQQQRAPISLMAETRPIAFADILRIEGPSLIRFLCRRMSNPDDAQDLAQEAMLRFARAAPKQPIDAPRAYLRQIAINLLRDRAARNATRLASMCVPLIEGVDIEDNVDQHRDIAARDELAQWEAILDELKPRTLEIFLLSRVDGFTYKEIADRFGMSVWNVHRHMKKAIGHIAQHRRVV